MLSIKRCREILGPQCSLSDEELRALLIQLYAIAETALAAYSSAREAEIQRGLTPDPGSKGALR